MMQLVNQQMWLLTRQGAVHVYYRSAQVSVLGRKNGFPLYRARMCQAAQYRQALTVLV
jgi:hypothetical protein